MDRRKFIKGVGAVAGSAAIAGCSGGSNQGGGSGDNEGAGQANASGQGGGQGDVGEFFDLDGNIAQNSDPNLQFLRSRLVRTGGQSLSSGGGGGNAGNFDFPWFGEQGGAGVIGAIRNTADRPMTSAEVSATLYDQGDNVLGTFGNSTEETGVQFLRPNQTWTFRIWFESVDLTQAARYTLSADGQLADNNAAIGAGQGNFLFGGNTVSIGQNGEVTGPNGEVLDTVEIIEDNQGQSPGFESVYVLPSGQVVNQNNEVVGVVDVTAGDFGNNSNVTDVNPGDSGMNATGNNSTGSR